MIFAAVLVEEKGLRKGLSPLENLRAGAKLLVTLAELMLLPEGT